MSSKKFNVNAVAGPMIVNALLTKTMGLTRHEMRNMGIPFKTKHGGNNTASLALRDLLSRGVVRVAGFKSGQRNGQGSSIYQLTNPSSYTEMLPVGGNPAMPRPRLAAKRKGKKSRKIKA